jgi:hypothetical protein
MKDTVEIRDIAAYMGLTDTDVTGGNNGYPEPYLGRFIGGFENVAQAVDFTVKAGGQIAIAHWRDGWHNVDLRNPHYILAEPFTPDDIPFGDDYVVVSSKQDLEWYILEGFEMAGTPDNVDWEKESLVYCLGVYRDRYPKEMMKYSHDTHHNEIGVWISND